MGVVPVTELWSNPAGVTFKRPDYVSEEGRQNVHGSVSVGGWIQPMGDSQTSGIAIIRLYPVIKTAGVKRRQVLKSSGLIATTAITSLAGCSSGSTGDTAADGEGGETTDDGGTGGDTPTTTSPSGSSSKTVLMVTEGGTYYFDPIGLFVESGETVTFEVKSGNHSATAYDRGNEYANVTRIPDGAEGWDSGVLSGQGTTFDHTFETAGTYDYFCIPHKRLGMVGRIVVGEPGGPAEGSMPPDGTVPESQAIVDRGAVSYEEFSQ